MPQLYQFPGAGGGTAPAPMALGRIDPDESVFRHLGHLEGTAAGPSPKYHLGRCACNDAHASTETDAYAYTAAGTQTNP